MGISTCKWQVLYTERTLVSHVRIVAPEWFAGFLAPRAPSPPRPGAEAISILTPFFAFGLEDYQYTHPYFQRHAGTRLPKYNGRSPGASSSQSESRESSSSRDAVFIFLPAGKIIETDMRQAHTLRETWTQISRVARPPLATKPLPAISSLDTRLKICHSQISLRFSCSQNLRILTLNNFDNFFIRRLAAHRAKRPSVARLHVVGHHVELLSLQGSRILWLAYTSTYAYMNEMDMGWI